MLCMKSWFVRQKVLDVFGFSQIRLWVRVKVFTFLAWNVLWINMRFKSYICYDFAALNWNSNPQLYDIFSIEADSKATTGHERPDLITHNGNLYVSYTEPTITWRKHYVLHHMHYWLFDSTFLAKVVQNWSWNPLILLEKRRKSHNDLAVLCCAVQSMLWLTAPSMIKYFSPSSN